MLLQTKITTWLTLVLIALIIGGCTRGSQPLSPSTPGDLTISAHVHSSLSSEQWTMEVIAVRGRHSFEERIPVSSSEFEETLSIPVGTWDITLLLLDGDDVPHFQDTIEDVTVFPDQPTTVVMNLRPANGNVLLHIVLDAFPGSSRVLRARVYFGDDMYELIRDSEEDELAGEFSLPPGSYDYRVELFTDSFRATDCIHPGIWENLTILPSIDQDLVWHPHTTLLTINAEILFVPESPMNLTGTRVSESETLLEWDSVTEGDAHIGGYQVLFQLDPFTRFEVVSEDLLTERRFIHQFDQTTLESARYTVVAISENDVLGYRSNIITAPILDATGQ